MKTLSFLVTFAFILISAHGQSFKAGAAIRVITPDPLLPVSGGVGQPNKVTEKKGDLYARALVFEKRAIRIAIVSIDNLGWPAVLGDKSRSLIKGIPPENILIGVTHTHSAPDAYGFPDENGQVGADFEYLEWCVSQIADAVNEAVNNLEPAVLKINVGKARGKIAYNYYAPELYDPRCGVIQAIATSGKNKDQPIVTLVNYATHPEIIGPDRGILSPDLCGPLYSRIEHKAGGIALFMNSAQGGMVTADNIGYYLKRNMPTNHPFLFGLTNDAFGYILTKVDFNSFKRYDYITRTSLGEKTGEIYIKEAMELISNSPKPSLQQHLK